MRNFRRIRSVRFVRPDDGDYRLHLSRHALRARRLGPKVEPHATSRLALSLEEIVRCRLRQIVPLANERILAYEIQDGQYGYEAMYLELDAVSGQLGTPLRIFEIKSTHSVKVALGGLKQLRRVREVIATHCHRKLIALIDIWVDTGGEPFEKDDPRWNRVTELEDLNALDGWHGDDSEFALIRIPCGTVWDWAAGVGVDVDEDLWERAQQELRDGRHLREKRRALREAGVPESEWPVELRAEPQRRLPGSYTTSTATNPETALATAFRNAAVRNRQE